MYKFGAWDETSLEINNSVEGETIEQKIERILNNNEPISDGAALIFTDRSEGVLPAYDPRTDRMEVALEGMDLVQKAQIAKREDRAKRRTETAKGGGKEDHQTDGSPETGANSGTSEPTTK